MGGIRWEVMSSYWNGTQSAPLLWQIQKLVVFVLSQRGVLSCLRFPVPRRVSFVGKTQSVFCAPGCLFCAHSVGKQAGQEGEINAGSVLKRNTLLLQLLKECNAELWSHLQWQSVLQHLGAQLCIFQSCIQDVFSRSASCYPTLSGFLGHQLNMQSGDSLYWFQFWVFDPWKGNLSASKSSQEKAILQSTESHSHTHLICFPYISSKSSYKTRICHYLTFCSTWEIYFR